MTPDLALPLQQHPHFAAALAHMGRSVCFVDVAGAAPVLAVRQFGQLLVSRGPIWHQAGHSAALRRAAFRMINADVRDDTLMRAAGLRCLMTPAHVAELDLLATPEARKHAMKPKWRRAWQAAQSTRLKISEHAYDAQTHGWILKADLVQQHSKGFRGLPHSLIGAYAAMHPKSVRVVIATQHQTPIAAMLFLLHRPVATYHIGWTSTRGSAVCAHHRMIVTAADLLAQRGYRRLDLGLVDTDTAPGLARFKIGTGAQVRPLGGTWVRLPGCAH
ncbi:GNAT family N-acetyltransferase [Yoonia sp.]|uniref:GNAT family N-acetyltransferase n=1 Tax=Yoonia sp. TaxID=2212373 RepID=UPI00358FF59B